MYITDLDARQAEWRKQENPLVFNFLPIFCFVPCRFLRTMRKTAKITKTTATQAHATVTGNVMSWMAAVRRSWNWAFGSPVKKLMRKSHENVIFSWESHENLTRFLWAFSSREKNEILMSKKARERFSWEFENSHGNVIFSWETHEILMRIQKLVRIFVRAWTQCNPQNTDG